MKQAMLVVGKKYRYYFYKTDHGHQEFWMGMKVVYLQVPSFAIAVHWLV